MRIDDFDEDRQLSSVGLSLTQSEARELMDALETLLADVDVGHVHVSSADYQTEVTVWIDSGSADASAQ